MSARKPAGENATGPRGHRIPRAYEGDVRNLVKPIQDVYARMSLDVAAFPYDRPRDYRRRLHALLRRHADVLLRTAAAIAKAEGHGAKWAAQERAGATNPPAGGPKPTRKRPRKGRA